MQCEALFCMFVQSQRGVHVVPACGNIECPWASLRPSGNLFIELRAILLWRLSKLASIFAPILRSMVFMTIRLMSSIAFYVLLPPNAVQMCRHRRTLAFILWKWIEVCLIHSKALRSFSLVYSLICCFLPISCRMARTIFSCSNFIHLPFF